MSSRLEHISPSELVAMPDSFPELANGGSAERSILAHLEQCQDCMNLARTYWSLREFRNPTGVSAPQLGCPDTATWMEFAAGLRPESAESMTLHASACTVCAEELQLALELLEDKTVEFEIQSHLTSSTQAWQKRLAAQIARGTVQDRNFQRDTRSKLPMGRFAWGLFGLAAIVIICVFSINFSRQNGLDRTNRLLAEAYSQQRSLSLRIPGAAYAPISGITRGDNTTRTAPLIEAEFIISKHERSMDPGWQLASANSDLLEGRFSNAIRTLENSSPDGSQVADFKIAIATAYFGRAGQLHSSEYLTKAREAIGVAIDKSPHNPIALFNRALIDQQMGLFDEAMIDWQQYLAVESEGQWSDEARRHFDDCKRAKAGKGQAVSESSLLTPERIVTGSSPETTDEVIDRRIEDYQKRAFALDYPMLSTSSSSVELLALRRLAIISSAMHDDQMLRDVLSAGKYSANRGAAQELASAIAANRTGNEQLALRLATLSSADFARHGNHAGSLRAQYEMLYALQFISRTDACIRLARKVAPNAIAHHYRWLAISAETEEGFCENMNGNLAGARRVLHRASELARDAGYESALERTRVGEADLEFQSGNALLASELALEGLQRFWVSAVPYQRGESFCDLLEIVAEQNQLWHVQSALLSESLSLLENEPDPLARAQIRVRLAGSDLMLNRADEAEANLKQALAAFRAAPQSTATLAQELSVSINLAKTEAEKHRYAASVDYLESLRPKLGVLHEDVSQIEFFTTLGESYRRLGNAAEAEKADQVAIRIFHSGLATLRLPSERLTWLRLISPAYRSLVQVHIDQKDPVAALRVWQQYRRESLSSGTSFRRTVNVETHSFAFPVTNVVYASLPESPYAWALSGAQFRALSIASSNSSLKQLSERFVAECSQPSSRTATITQDAKTLYRLLVEPFTDLLPANSIFAIQPDDEFGRIPFSALVDSQNHYLNEGHSVVVSPFSG